MVNSRTDNWFERNRHVAGGLVAAGALILVEGALRLADPDIYRFVSEARQVHEYDPAWRVRLRPNASGRFLLQREGGESLYDFRISTDRNGFRVGERTAAPDPRARFIHAIGDSFTMGWGVSYEESYPAVLETLLGDQSRVLNLGVDGFGTIGATGRSREIWRDFPASATVYLFSPNDFDDDENAAWNAARGPLFHAGMRALDAVRRHSYLANTPFVAKWWLYFRPAMSASPAPWTKAIPPPMEAIPVAPPRTHEEPANLSMKTIENYRDFTRSKGSRLLVLAIEAPESHRFLSFCAARGIEAYLLRISEAHRIPGEGHLNAEGNRQLARLVASLLAKDAAR
ncbi:MAG: hypothetical protein ACHQJD_01995 [Thermoanaerobaculia bacterium]